jgi:hypothetical protein
MKKILLAALICITTFTIGTAIHRLRPRCVGTIEAYFDLFRGRQYIKVWGLFAEDGEKYSAIYKDYGVEILPVGHCFISEELREEIVAYNGISMAAIEKKYGKSIQDRFSRERGLIDYVKESRKKQDFAARCELQRQ